MPLGSGRLVGRGDVEQVAAHLEGAGSFRNPFFLQVEARFRAGVVVALYAFFLENAVNAQSSGGSLGAER